MLLIYRIISTSNTFLKTKKTLALIALVALLTMLSGCFSLDIDVPDGHFQTSHEQPMNNDLTEAEVSRVVDGDTIEVVIDNTTEKVRLIGVDTPETVHPTIGEEPYGRQASDFTKSKLSGQSVGLEFDVEERDRYGRLLAYVWLGDQMFNEVLLREGYAQLATYPPNVKYVDRFTGAQEEARQQQRGLWGEIEETDKEQRDQSTGSFVGSVNSNKYHYPDCPGALQIKSTNQIWFNSEEEAVKAGYHPCQICSP
jgi:micrococcal nuclease